MQERYRYGQLRFWEMFPGLLAWGTFLLAIFFTFVNPLWVIVFIIIFDLLWLFRVIYFNVFVILSWKRYRDANRINWQGRLKEIDHSHEIHHIIFLPTYKEEYSIIRSTLKSLRANSTPNNKMIVVLGGEEADQEQFQKNARRAEQEFGRDFKRLFVTLHPSGLKDEVPGKGSNLNWMGHKVKGLLEREFPEVQEDKLIVSAFDVDTIAHKQYFSYLTYLFCTVKDPLRASYQPIALFSNNIWTSSAPVRIGAFGTTFWLFGELARPERLWTFSSHSMPWKMLIDVGFWQKDIVSEDSRIFMQGFLHYHGDYRVEPMFLPVSMDAVSGSTYRESLRALYVQMRRWAWGVEHLPYIIDGFKRDKTIPLRKKMQYIFNHIEGMYTWSTAPIIMFVLGWFPLLLARDQTAALVQAAPFTLQQLMQFAMIGILISAIMSLMLLPRRPEKIKKHTWAVMFLQWALLPITFIIFGSFPAIDAQTRLMTGRYLGFDVTKKGRS
jgi:hypothetical protein